MKKRFSVALRWFSLLLTIMLMMNSSVNPVYAEVVLNMAVKGSLIEGTTVTLSWNSMDDTDYYLVSLRDLTTDKLLYNRQNVGTKTSFRIDVDLEADHSYRAWVAAIANGSDPAVIPSSHQTQKEFTIKPDVCLHDGETYKDNVKKIYKSISDDEHRVTTTYDLCCYDCDEVLEENKTEVVIDPHDFDENGDCYLCDYTFSCTHKEKDIELDKSAYSVIDEDTHLYFEMGHYVCANANCGKEIEPYYYEEEEEHVFKNNTCRYCGYTKTEPLSIIVARGQQTAFVGDGITASVTTEGGSGSFDYAWEVLCNGTVVDKTDYSMSTSWGYEATKVGEWQFKVYVKDTVTNEEMTAVTSIITVTEAVCAHSNPKEEKGKTEYEKYSDIKHEIIEYYSIVCSDCGEVLSDVNYRSTLEDHAVDASGQCICGYAAPTDICEHTESKPVQIGDPKVEQYDEKWHKVITTYQDVCANDECGVILVASREETEMVVHEYDSEGACLCGYVEPTEKCDHAPNETLTNTEYKEIDENDHEIIRTYHYECECGQVNHDESLTTTEAHNFIEGLCALCGYVQPYIPEVKISGAFGSDSYTMTVGETLGISASASAVNANLTRVTVTVDGSGDDDHDHQDITGTEWSGSLTLDGNKHPLNVPGTYTIKLFAKVDAGDPNYAIVDYATVVVTEPEIAISGAFSSESYTMTVGETLSIPVSASATNANLTRVTVTVDGSGDDDHDHQDISGTEWSGSLTLDGNKHPLNVPGAYTIKLFAKVDAGDPNYAIVDYATVVVTEPEIAISGAFGSDSYTMTVGETLGISASASATNANLTRVTVTVDGSGDDDHDHKDISGTEWSGSLTLDGNKHPLNVPGTYTIKLFAKVDAGDPNYAIVDYATVVVTEAPEEPVKPESPVVNVALAGDTMTASWNAVEGSERYVYSLRNLTDDQSIEWHKNADGCMVTAVLEVGKQYKIAVAAVPAGVADTEAEADKCAWAEVVFVVPSEEEIKLDAPTVNVTVDGVNMTATWTSVEGADRYVYSLYNITDDQRIAVHQTANNCAATAVLDAGKQYRIAVAAVPAFVKDTQAETEKCSWTEAVFATLSEEELNKMIPGVLSVVSNAADKTLLPGETFTATVICNKYTSDLRVSGAENGNVSRMHIDAYGRNCFDYTASFSANGVYHVRFTAIDPNGIYVENQLYSVVVPVTVCDHTVGEPVLVSESDAVYSNNYEHLIVYTYKKACICEKIVEIYPENKLSEHVTNPNAYQYQLEHENGLGHRKYFECSVCKGHPLSGGDNPEKKDYIVYVERLGSANKCSVCRNEYNQRQRVKEAQNLLQGLGYDIGTAGVDGILGKDTLAALNAFRANVMGLGAIGYVDNDTLEALRTGINKNNEQEIPLEQESSTQQDSLKDEKQVIMNDSVDILEDMANGKNSIYDQFFTYELRKEIELLSEGTAAKIYDFIAGDATALISTAQADYYVDTLMKQCAGINSDSKTISISPEDFSMLCSFLGLDDAIFNKMLEKWTEDRWTDKYGNVIQEKTPYFTKINIKKDDFQKEMEKYEFKGFEYLGNGIDIGSYLWDCLYDYHVYTTAFEGATSIMIDSAYNNMKESDLYAAELASLYIKSCETVEGRISYIMLKNANIVDFARDKAFDAMLYDPSFKLAHESATLFNDVMFGTTDMLEANHGTFWSMQIVEELHTELNSCIDRYKNDPSEDNYNDCLGTYSLYMTYLISTYNGVLDSIEIYSSSLAANMIGDGLTDKEKALVEQMRMFMDWYADDIEYALENQTVEAIMNRLRLEAMSE